MIEREALKCALQEPQAVEAWYESVEESSYLDDTNKAVHAAIIAAGGPRAEITGLAWSDAVLERCPDDALRAHVRSLSVEPLPANVGSDARYATSVVARLLELSATRHIAELRGRMQRIDESADPVGHAAAFAELMAVEAYKRELREQVNGA